MPRKRIPQPCYHKGTGRWYVTLRGKEEYLSGRLPWSATPPAEVQSEYDRVMSAWLTARAQPPDRLGSSPLVAEVCSSYLGTIGHYSGGERRNVIEVVRILAQEAGGEPIAGFSAGRLRQVRQKMIDGEPGKEGGRSPWAAHFVNKQVSRLRRMFRWAVVEGLVPAEVWHGLRALPGLRESKRDRRARRVEEVPDELIEATLPHIHERLRSMVQAHRLIGCRAQEIVVARTCDFDLDADPDQGEHRCWLFTPSESKTDERYWVGPRAQEVLRPLLNPAEPLAWLWPTRVKKGKGRYSTASYRRFIERACIAGGVKHWSVLQIRHAAAEEARRKHPKALEAAQARLRHARMQVSEIYANDLSALGRDVARKLG